MRMFINVSENLNHLETFNESFPNQIFKKMFHLVVLVLVCQEK
jgi:hypothetical protein